MIEAVLGALGILTQLGGAFYSAYQQKEEAEKAAKIAEKNKAAAERAASDAIARGGLQASAIRHQGTRMIGAQRAGFAAQGVDISSGSALEIQGMTRVMSEYDAALAQNNAMREAWGYRTEGENFSAQAAALKTAGTNQAIGTLLGGFGQAAASTAQAWSSYQRSQEAQR